MSPSVRSNNAVRPHRRRRRPSRPTYTNSHHIPVGRRTDDGAAHGEDVLTFVPTSDRAGGVPRIQNLLNANALDRDGKFAVRLLRVKPRDLEGQGEAANSRACVLEELRVICGQQSAYEQSRAWLTGFSRLNK